MLALLLASGCIDATTVVLVKKDGSGSVFDIVFIGKGLQQMIHQMSASMGGEAAAGEIARTNASYVEIDTQSKKRQLVTPFLTPFHISCFQSFVFS
jgi:hypothetical protein